MKWFGRLGVGGGQNKSAFNFSYYPLPFYKSILIPVSFIVFSGYVKAQQNDFGVWAGVAVNHKFTQNFSATVEEQFRFDHNATAIAQYFTDAGAEYSLSKKFKVSLSYRFANNYKKTYFSKRHRVSIDLSYKTKISKIQLMLRTRLQEQQADINSSDLGHIPEWYSRNKLTAKLDLDQKYSPYLGVEAFYLISKPGDDGHFIDKWRYSAGVEYKFNRVHALDVYYLIQRERNVKNPLTDYVAGIGYVFSF